MTNIHISKLPTLSSFSHNSGQVYLFYVFKYLYRAEKVIDFNGKTPSFYNMMYTQIFHKHID